MAKRANQGHVAVLQVPLRPGISHYTYVAAFAPRAQDRGNVIVADCREVQLMGNRFARFAATHVNACGTDLSDLRDFAEEAAKTLGYELPRDLDVVVWHTPIRKASRSHKGSPRTAAPVRRVRRQEVTASVGASA